MLQWNFYPKAKEIIKDQRVPKISISGSHTKTPIWDFRVLSRNSFEWEASKTKRQRLPKLSF